MTCPRHARDMSHRRPAQERPRSGCVGKGLRRGPRVPVQGDDTSPHLPPSPHLPIPPHISPCTRPCARRCGRTTHQDTSMTCPRHIHRRCGLTRAPSPSSPSLPARERREDTEHQGGEGGWGGVGTHAQHTGLAAAYQTATRCPVASLSLQLKLHERRPDYNRHTRSGAKLNRSAVRAGVGRSGGRRRPGPRRASAH